MARQATKACGNRYYEARMRAAMYNEKFLTRAGAVESLPGVTEDSLKKYELDTGAYAKAENSDFFLFNDGTGSYQTLQQYVKTPLFLDYIKGKLDEFSADIKIDEEALSQYRISKVKSNYNF